MSIIASTSEFHVLCHNRREVKGFWCLWIVLSWVLAGVFGECSTSDSCPWPICLFTHRYNVPLSSPGQENIVTLLKMSIRSIIPIFFISVTWISEDQFRNPNLASKIVSKICGCSLACSNPVSTIVLFVCVSKSSRSIKSVLVVICGIWDDYWIGITTLICNIKAFLELGTFFCSNSRSEFTSKSGLLVNN